ncbi:MAG: DUF2339 domain-containing protein [Phycisphaerae bacterium]|nr:DUF2339 domain-containing protein [Phycisphaerae bacterium]
MDGHRGELEAQLRALSARLDRVEQRLGIDRVTPPPPEAGADPAAEQASSSTPDRAPFQVRAPRPQGARTLDLEQRIGARWYAIVGAVILIIGVGIGFKWAHDAGLLRLTPAWRCLLGAGFGLALLGVGEVVRPRYGAWAAAGASIAGIGSLFVSAFAAYRLFALLPPASAFLLLTATAGVGIAVGARARLAAVGITSLVAGYAVPIVFADEPARPLVMPAYLLALLAVGLTLSGWIGGRFAGLRTAGWWGTIAVGGVWALSRGPGFHAEALAFLVLAWAAIQGELLYSARRHGLGTPGEAGERRLRWRAWRPLISSLSTTWWAAAAAVPVLDAWGTLPTWAAPASLLPPTAVLWMALAGHLSLLEQRPSSDTERLGVSMALQAAGLLVATVALAFEGSLEVAGWLALGVAAAGAGNRLNSRAFALYGVVLIVIATARLILFDSVSGTLTTPAVETLGLRLSLWSLLVAGSGAAWIGAAALFPSQARWVPALLTSVGLACLLASVLSPDSAGAAVVWAWIILSTLALVSRRPAPRLSAHVAGGLGLLATSVAWGLVHVSPAGAAGGWAAVDAPLLMHPGLWAGLALAGAWGLAAWVYRREHSTRPGVIAVADAGAVMACVVLLTATSLEAARAGRTLTANPAVQASFVSIWWGLFAMGLLVVGFARRSAGARRAGLALLGVAVLKAVVFDLASAPMFWRFISFVGLGLLMLTATVVYGRAPARVARADRQRSGRPPGSGA